jgi:hypothetical protein
MKPKSGAKKLNKVFGTSAYDTATERNYEGAPAFVRGDEEQLVRVLTTGTFEQTFYASDIELAAEAVALFRQFATEDPHFLAQAIVYARNEGLMRTAPITALVVLSAVENPDAKEMFRRIFPKVIRTPGDLRDFLTLCRLKTLRGMGKAVTRATQRWLAEISQYHAIKYGSESQEMSLRDIYRLARPKLTGEANDIARYLVRGEIAPELTQIAGYEELKREAAKLRRAGALDADGASGDATLDEAEKGRIEERILTLIAEHRLPWEVVVTQVRGSAAVWSAMLYQMPYMACLAEGTPIWLPDGTTAPIEEVVERRLSVLSYNKAWDTRPIRYGYPMEPPRDHAVGRLVSTMPAAWIASGVRPVKTIHLRSGRVLDATVDHRWITQRRNGRKSWEWRTTEMLAVGDHIPVPLTARFFGSLGSEDDGYFIGAMLGDGGMTSVTPEFHGDPLDGATAFMRQYAAEHDCRVVEIPLPSDKIVRMRFPFKQWKRNPLAEVLRAYDVWGLRCEAKSLPNQPFSTSFWIGCLSGLIDTDGCVRERRNAKGTFHASVEYATVSGKLAHQVSDALLRLGVMNRVHSHMANARAGERIISRLPIHVVEVSRATAVVRLSEVLHLRIGYKSKMLAHAASQLLHVQPTTSDMYGHDPSVALDQITAIEDGGEKAVYCVTVEPSNVFIANGIITGNCLRNLNNAVRYGVTDQPEALEYIAYTLSDRARVASSKQFPFAFFSALKALKAEGEVGDWLRTALSQALEDSFVNMPELGRRVLIANDVSGSMSARQSRRSDMTMSEIAGVFAAAAFKKAEEGQIVSFDTSVHPRQVTKDQTIAEIAAAVSGHGGGTSLSAPLEYAFGVGRGEAYDVVIFLTDSESWYDHLTRNRGALDLIREYRARINPELKCFFIQLVPYKHAVVPQDEPGCYYVYGWSSSILGYIASMVDGGQSQVDHVRQVSVL